MTVNYKPCVGKMLEHIILETPNFIASQNYGFVDIVLYNVPQLRWDNLLNFVRSYGTFHILQKTK